MRASRIQMAVALVLLAGAAGAPTREHLSSKAGVLVPNQLSGDEGAAEHTTRSHHLASSDESRGAKGISISDARPHDLERRDNTPRKRRCDMTVGGGATSGARDLLNLPQHAWIHRGSPTVRADAPERIGASATGHGVGTTCPDTSEGKTCNQHYCASSQLHAPPARAPRRPASRVL